jgi:hypothetical protein
MISVPLKAADGISRNRDVCNEACLLALLLKRSLPKIDLVGGEGGQKSLYVVEMSSEQLLVRLGIDADANDSASLAPGANPVEGGTGFIPSGVKADDAPAGEVAEVGSLRRPLQLFLHGFPITAEHVLELDNVCRDLLKLPRVAGTGDVKLAHPGRVRTWESVLLVHGDEVKRFADLPDFPFHQESLAGLVVINGVVRKDLYGPVGGPLSDLVAPPRRD